MLEVYMITFFFLLVSSLICGGSVSSGKGSFSIVCNEILNERSEAETLGFDYNPSAPIAGARYLARPHFFKMALVQQNCDSLDEMMVHVLGKHFLMPKMHVSTVLLITCFAGVHSVNICVLHALLYFRRCCLWVN